MNPIVQAVLALACIVLIFVFAFVDSRRFYRSDRYRNDTQKHTCATHGGRHGC